VDEIFSQEEGDRDPLIKMYLIDMVVYHVFSRATPRNIPQIRIDRYDKAIAWLRDVATGKLTPALPALIDPDTEESASNSRFGSNEKFNSEY
jgi:phage gp36-like protein